MAASQGGHRQAPEVHGGEIEGQGKGAVVGAEEQEGQALEKNGGADGADQRHQGMRTPERPEGHPLQDQPQEAGARQARGHGHHKGTWPVARSSTVTKAPHM